MPRLSTLKGKLVEQNKRYIECAKALNISATAFCSKMNEKAGSQPMRRKYSQSF